MCETAPSGFRMSDRNWVAPYGNYRTLLATVSFVFICSVLTLSQLEAPNVVCHNGDGVFDAEFRTGVKVHVGAAKNRGFAAHSCAATLTWDKEELLVASEVSQLDLDAFGIDLGDGVPVAAFKEKKSHTDRLHHLRLTKIKLLETVWAYLYSGREQDAWHSLAEMWPPTDIDRIRGAILKVRANGIHSQVNGVSDGPPLIKKKPVRIFPVTSGVGPDHKSQVVPPRAILLELPPASDVRQSGVPRPKLLLDLVIDAAGKVRSAEPTEKAETIDPPRMKLAMTWKFIPAFKDDRPVASRLRIVVSPKQ
jgi:hypothetical protein